MSTDAYLRKFYGFSIYSIMVPIVCHVMGFYYLYQAIKGGGRPKTIPTIASVLLYLCSAVLGIGYLRSWL